MPYSKNKHGNVAVFVPHVGCPHMCSFCDQRSITGKAEIPHRADVERICGQAFEEIKNKSEAEIAFFGGSFTAISRNYMLELLEAAKPFLGEGGFKGIRISTRPDSISEEILDLLKGYGVTTIALGVQSLDAWVLSANDRGHTASDVEKAAELIKRKGFTLGLQMMVGLYKSTPQLDRFTAERLIEWCPSEVRIYPVAVIDGTRLAELYKSGEYKTYELEKAVELCAELIMMFENEGIRVIKVGLHASDDVEKKLVGGLYHPAFRELCDNFIYRSLMLKAVEETKPKSISFTVPKGQLSKALGQKRSNVIYFKEKGIDIQVSENEMQTERLAVESKK